MTPAQRKMARHALGLEDGRKVSYRNRYFAELGTTHEDGWDEMCRRGLAVRGDNGIAIIGFALTAAGAQEALDPGETLDCEDFPSALSPASRGPAA